VKPLTPATGRRRRSNEFTQACPFGINPTIGIASNRPPPPQRGRVGRSALPADAGRDAGLAGRVTVTRLLPEPLPGYPCTRPCSGTGSQDLGTIAFALVQACHLIAPPPHRERLGCSPLRIRGPVASRQTSVGDPGREGPASVLFRHHDQ